MHIFLPELSTCAHSGHDAAILQLREKAHLARPEHPFAEHGALCRVAANPQHLGQQQLACQDHAAGTTSLTLLNAHLCYMPWALI